MCLLRNTSRVGNIRNAPPVDCSLTTPSCSAVGLLQRTARLFPARLSSAADQWSTLSRCDRSASNWRDPERSTACESQIVNIKNTVSFPVSITTLPHAVRFPSSLTRTATVWTTFDNWVRRPPVVWSTSNNSFLRRGQSSQELGVDAAQTRPRAWSSARVLPDPRRPTPRAVPPYA